MLYLKRLFWLTTIIFLLFLNNLIGYVLGAWGNCRQAVINNNIHLYTSCRGNTGHLISNILNARAITVGDYILTPEISLPREVLLHELAHVKQYHLFGPAFLPLYACAEIAAWTDTKIFNYKDVRDSNIFEYWADATK